MIPLSGTASRRPLSRQSSLLFDWRADDGSLIARTGQVLTLTRASTGTVVTPNGTVTVPSGMERFSMVDTDGDSIVDTTTLRADNASSPRVAEVWTATVTLPLALYPTLTVYVKHRPDWYATSGGITTDAYLWTLGNAVPRISLKRDGSDGKYTALIDTVTTDATATQTAPTTRVQEVCVQLTALTTGGKAQVDCGSGLGTLSSAATAIAALGNTTLYFGCFSSTGNEAVSGILALKIAAGALTLAQMQVAN